LGRAYLFGPSTVCRQYAVPAFWRVGHLALGKLPFNVPCADGQGEERKRPECALGKITMDPEPQKVNTALKDCVEEVGFA
jgi:hypothetical protein